MSTLWLEKAEKLDWEQNRRFLQRAHFRPLYDRAFSQLLETLATENYFRDPESLRQEFIQEFDRWIHGSRLNQLSGLKAFPHRDFIVGVTHTLDDLHITYGSKIVILEKEYAYHRRMKPAIPQRRLETLEPGDVLVMSAPFAWYGDLHPEMNEILDRCLALSIPVHIDAAWYGCLKDFILHCDHPAIQTVSFSLSKGLGLGAHRAGVRYARERHAGPVTIINDFNMGIASVMWYGLHFMRQFGSDYIQTRYGSAYSYICEKLDLRETKAIHLAFQKDGDEESPVGIRPFLRYLVDDVDEFK
ncbi:hypothetical protein [Bdellovibrio sp. HCB2-146]|uniref:hypothetical protein n=1 Tax=Bdellovibrio sp. HCB2-146 TaxID=3394362 RepID=UPI0039BCB99C